MPIGNALPGNAFRVLVATAALPTVFVPLGLMNTFDISGELNSADFDTFDSDDPLTFYGKARRTLSLSGFLGDTDSGQALVLAAWTGKLDVVLKFLWDGTNGFTQQCKVNARKSTARAGNTPVDVSFDFKPTTAAGTIVGTGPML